MKEITMQKVAPIAERIVALHAAANLQHVAAEIKEDGTVLGANAAQLSLNKGEEYMREAYTLTAQCREIARNNGDRLPGIEGLKAIASSPYAKA
jgi:hypothetical protein